MTNPVVSVAVSITQAPAPSTLQRTGAMLLQGGTNTSAGTKTFLATSSSLTPFLAAALAITSIAWASGVATVTTTTAHGITVGDQFLTTIAGAVPTVYNGTFLASATGASTFTYQLASDGGTTPATGTKTYTPRNQAELVAMNTTFFAQGTGPGAYALELGAGEVNGGVTFLTNWIAQNPNTFYSYLVPRSWDGNANFLAFLANFDANNAKTYFFVTTTLQNYPLYAGLKCVIALIEAPDYGIWAANVITALSQTSGVATATTTSNHGILPNQWFQMSGNAPAGWNGWFFALPGTATDSITFNVPSTLGAESALGTLVQSQYASAGVPVTEFSHAADWWVSLNYKPSGTNKVTPFNLSYLFGVTLFPIQGNASLLTTLDAADVSIVGTGAQGGISNKLLQGGNNQDGNPFNFWYSVDWAQINAAIDITAYLINGSNNPQNPVYYDQPGINGGQTVLAGTMQTGITGGLVLNPIKMTQLDSADFVAALDADTFSGYTVVNADPFPSYIEENPNDYADGVYNGWSIDYTPLRGFDSITIAINVSTFPV